MISNGELYRKLPNLTIGFHGCNSETYNDVIINKHSLKYSTNVYDWLGNGIYFWENSYERARDWAKTRYKDDACVIGALIDLGHCLNITDYASKDYLELGYQYLKFNVESAGVSMPKNKKGKNSDDLLLRDLDCSVIQSIHKMMAGSNLAFDSVRGVFTEGKPIYEGAGILDKTHIQICVVNPNCIKGYFTPLEMNTKYKLP